MTFQQIPDGIGIIHMIFFWVYVLLMTVAIILLFIPR
jgi:hypothetical protein